MRVIKLFSGMLHFPPLGLEVRHLLGSGSFAQVYACFDPKDNKHYALKVLFPHSDHLQRGHGSLQNPPIRQVSRDPRVPRPPKRREVPPIPLKLNQPHDQNVANPRGHPASPPLGPQAKTPAPKRILNRSAVPALALGRAVLAFPEHHSPRPQARQVSAL